MSKTLFMRATLLKPRVFQWEVSPACLLLSISTIAEGPSIPSPIMKNIRDLRGRMSGYEYACTHGNSGFFFFPSHLAVTQPVKSLRHHITLKFLNCYFMCELLVVLCHNQHVPQSSLFSPFHYVSPEHRSSVTVFSTYFLWAKPLML